MNKDKNKQNEQKENEKCQCEECTCEACECDGDECHCEDCKECECEECNSTSKADEYLMMAKQIQAEFENYRKRSIVAFEKARLDGKLEIISGFLSPLDALKKAKDTIKDEKVLEGVLMIEKSIIGALDNAGVEKIQAVGEVFDPNLHNAIAVVSQPNEKDNIVVDEYQAGYKMGDKIIRYSQVIVNKKGE